MEDDTHLQDNTEVKDKIELNFLKNIQSKKTMHRYKTIVLEVEKVIQR